MKRSFGLALLLVALLVCGTPTTAGAKSATTDTASANYIYGCTSNVPADGEPLHCAPPQCTSLPHGGTASPPVQTRGTPTTPLARNNATNTVRYGPSNPGPLLDDVASTFRSGSYTGEVLQSETTLYRVYGGESGPIGSYWSRTAPSGPMQAQIDSALNPAWGNTATNVATIRVPAGTTIYDGVAAAQSLPGGGTLLGGGSQVYIPKVNPDWLVP